MYNYRLQEVLIQATLMSTLPIEASQPLFKIEKITTTATLTSTIRPQQSKQPSIKLTKSRDWNLMSATSPTPFKTHDGSDTHFYNHLICVTFAILSTWLETRVTSTETPSLTTVSTGPYNHHHNNNNPSRPMSKTKTTRLLLSWSARSFLSGSWREKRSR